MAADCYFYYADYLLAGSRRVRRMDAIVDDVSGSVQALPSTAQDVAWEYTGGADGIVISPQSVPGNDVLLVGGQNTGKLFFINTTGYASSTKNWASRVSNLPATFETDPTKLVAAQTDHVVVVSNSLVLVFSNDFGRNIARHTVLAGGDVSVGTPVSVSGVDAWISTLIVAPNGKFFYTTGNEAGHGNFGEAIVDNAWTSIQTRRILTAGAYHHGTYEPVTNKVYTWGVLSVNQHDPATGALEATRDVSALARATAPSSGTNHQLDGGKADLHGRLLVAVNSGRLLWIDLRTASLATTTKIGYTIILLKNGLDDVTRIQCPNTPAPTNAPTNAPTSAPTNAPTDAPTDLVSAA